MGVRGWTQDERKAGINPLSGPSQGLLGGMWLPEVLSKKEAEWGGAVGVAERR